MQTTNENSMTISAASLNPLPPCVAALVNEYATSDPLQLWRLRDLEFDPEELQFLPVGETSTCECYWPGGWFWRGRNGNLSLRPHLMGTGIHSPEEGEFAWVVERENETEHELITVWRIRVLPADAESDQAKPSAAIDLQPVENEEKTDSSLFAFVFTAIWSDPELKESILTNVKHELSRESSRMDIADVVLTLLEEDVAVLSALKLREVLEIELLIEFLVAYIDEVPLDPEYLEQNGYGPKLLEPKVTASCYSDDHVIEVGKFDATPWFAQADDDELRALQDEDYGGDSTSDSVAEFMATYNRRVQAVFDHNDSLPESVELRGFECHVQRQEAEAWIAKHRPHVIQEVPGE